MSTKTTNLELVKPGLDDTRDITVLNGDFDIIDEAVAARALKSEAVKNITRSGLTFTVTRCNGTTFTFTQQDTTYGDATTSAHGLMTAADKSKLNGIANNANNYSLPLAANGTRGGVQVGYSQNGRNFPVQLSGEKMYVNVPGYTLPEASSSTLGGVKTGYSQNGKNYPVALSSGKMFVYVPWENTEYNDATTSQHGLMSAADKTKLNGIANGANNYSLPAASSTTRGGVKTGYTQNGRNYPVELSGEKMFVNVPWEDHTVETTKITVTAHFESGHIITYVDKEVTRSGYLAIGIIGYVCAPFFPKDLEIVTDSGTGKQYFTGTIAGVEPASSELDYTVYFYILYAKN